MHHHKYNNPELFTFVAKLEDIRLTRVSPPYPLPWPQMLTTLECYNTSEMTILATLFPLFWRTSEMSFFARQIHFAPLFFRNLLIRSFLLTDFEKALGQYVYKHFFS